MIGTISAVIFFEAFAFSDYFGSLLGGTSDLINFDPLRRLILASDTKESTTISLVFAITSFWFLDFALCIFQPAVNALLADRASAQQQKPGNGMLASKFKYYDSIVG